MYLNKKYLNNIAKAQDITPDRCFDMYQYIDAFETRPQRIWMAIEKLIAGIGGFAEDLHDYCNNPLGDKDQLKESWLQKVGCAILYLEGVLFLFPGQSTRNVLRRIVDALLAHTTPPHGGPQDKKAFCEAMTKAIEKLWALEMEDWLKEYGQYMQLTPQNIPIRCPESVVDQVVDGLPQPWQDDIEQIRVVLAILLAAIATAAIALAAAIQAGVPAWIATVAYNGAIQAARFIAITALALLGFTDEAAADVADSVVDGVEACGDSASIDVEEEEKGSGCCLDGEVIDDVPGGENGCLDIGGTWGDLAQLGCLVVPEDEK